MNTRAVRPSRLEGFELSARRTSVTRCVLGSKCEGHYGYQYSDKPSSVTRVFAHVLLGLKNLWHTIPSQLKRVDSEKESLRLGQ